MSDAKLPCAVVPPAVHVAGGNQGTVVGVATTDVSYWNISA